MAFHLQDLMLCLPNRDGHCHVAFSGGMDSHVLLHAMARLRDTGEFSGSLSAIHVNHGLSVHASTWADHCSAICAILDVPLEVVPVTVQQQGQGLEQAARTARYAVFTKLLNATAGVILTAHHLDDQVETQLFRLMRGTGMRGLAGIQRQRVLGGGSLVRPFLGTTRADLLAYAKQEDLDWIEDDSNADERLDRNYLRHLVVPVLASRWPGYRKNMQRLAGLAEEGQSLVEEIGSQDLAQVREGIHRIAIEALQQFSPARQHNIIRSWFLDLEQSQGLPVPDHYVIERIFKELIPAAQDAEPVITWYKEGQKLEVRRFANRIYVLQATLPEAESAPVSWQIETPLHLPGLGTLFVVETADEGFLTPTDNTLEIRFRGGGETAKPAGRKTRPLKKILQDYQVPPWLREKIPLFYQEGELLAVGDLFVTDQWWVSSSGAKGKKIHQIRWHRADLHCGY